MRRVFYLLVIALVAAALWQWQTRGTLPGLEGGFSFSGVRAPASRVPEPQPELRIEIKEAADEADARYREIIARFGEDPAAQAWVADCVAQAAAGEARASDQASWEYACWRSWGDKQTSVQRPAS